MKSINQSPISAPRKPKSPPRSTKTTKKPKKIIKLKIKDLPTKPNKSLPDSPQGSKDTPKGLLSGLKFSPKRLKSLKKTKEAQMGISTDNERTTKEGKLLKAKLSGLHYRQPLSKTIQLKSTKFGKEGKNSKICHIISPRFSSSTKKGDGDDRKGSPFDFLKNGQKIEKLDSGRFRQSGPLFGSLEDGRSSSFEGLEQVSGRRVENLQKKLKKEKNRARLKNLELGFYEDLGTLTARRADVSSASSPEDHKTSNQKQLKMSKMSKMSKMPKILKSSFKHIRSPQLAKKIYKHNQSPAQRAKNSKNFAQIDRKVEKDDMTSESSPEPLDPKNHSKGHQRSKLAKIHDIQIKIDDYGRHKFKSVNKNKFDRPDFFSRKEAFKGRYELIDTAFTGKRGHRRSAGGAGSHLYSIKTKSVRKLPKWSSKTEFSQNQLKVNKKYPVVHRTNTQLSKSGKKSGFHREKNSFKVESFMARSRVFPSKVNFSVVIDSIKEGRKKSLLKSHSTKNFKKLNKKKFNFETIDSEKFQRTTLATLKASNDTGSFLSQNLRRKYRSSRKQLITQKGDREGILEVEGAPPYGKELPKSPETALKSSKHSKDQKSHHSRKKSSGGEIKYKDHINSLVHQAKRFMPSLDTETAEQIAKSIINRAEKFRVENYPDQIMQRVKLMPEFVYNSPISKESLKNKRKNYRRKYANSRGRTNTHLGRPPELVKGYPRHSAKRLGKLIAQKTQGRAERDDFGEKNENSSEVEIGIEHEEKARKVYKSYLESLKDVTNEGYRTEEYRTPSKEGLSGLRGPSLSFVSGLKKRGHIRAGSRSKLLGGSRGNKSSRSRKKRSQDALKVKVWKRGQYVIEEGLSKLVNSKGALKLSYFKNGQFFGGGWKPEENGSRKVRLARRHQIGQNKKKNGFIQPWSHEISFEDEVFGRNFSGFYDGKQARKSIHY